MSRDTGYLQYILEEIMPDVPGITSRGMFGGFGLYKNGVIFGLIIQDQLYFKVNDSTREDYLSRGSKAFSFDKKNKKMISLNYYEVPSEIMEDRNEIVIWIEKAYEVGKSTKK